MGENIGTIVALNDNGSRVSYLLCSGIENDEWLVHRGSYENGALATQPLQEADLIQRNIMKGAWSTSANKRVRSNSHFNTLRACYVQLNHCLWRELIAIANYRSEEIRAQKSGGKFDEDRVALPFKPGSSLHLRPL